MPALYHTEERDGKTLDVLSWDATGLRLKILRYGAEMVSLSRPNHAGESTGFLYRDDDVTPPASGWTNHATVMGFFTHRLVEERTLYRGRAIRGGTHSFVRYKEFAAPEWDEDNSALTYRLGPEQIAVEDYPLRVKMALTYALEPDRVRVSFDFENEEDVPAHVSFGMHPGFAVTTLESCQVWMPAGTYVQHLAPGNFLSGETKEMRFSGGIMPFPKSELPGAFLLELKEVEDPVFKLADPRSLREIGVDLREAPYVTLWSDGNAFICIEPCWGLPDHHEQRPFEAKLGMQEIPANGRLRRSFAISATIGD